MLVDVETFLLYSLVNTNTYSLVYYLENNIGDNDAIDDAHYRSDDLNPELMPITIKGTLYALGTGYIFCGENTCEDRT